MKGNDAERIENLDDPNTCDWANIKDEDRFGENIILHVYQPGETALGVKPRIKIYRESWSAADSIVVMIDIDPEKITPVPNPSGFISSDELSLVVQAIRKYRRAFITFWNDRYMAASELTSDFQKIDDGN